MSPKRPPAMTSLLGDLEARIRRLGRGTVVVTIGVLGGLPAWHRTQEERMTEDDWRRLMCEPPRGKTL